MTKPEHEGVIAAFMERCFNDLEFFTKMIWQDRDLEKVAPLREIELEMVGHAAVGAKRRGVLGPRGIGKTTLVTAVLTCWRLFRDKNRQIFIVSKSENEPRKTVFLIRSWLENVWFLQHLVPTPGTRDAATFFDVAGCAKNRQPSVSCIGIGGQTEGNRAHTILADDVETKNNTKTIDARNELERLCSEFVNILYPDVLPFDQGGPIDPVEVVYVGTLKHEDTLYLRLSNKGYDFRTYPLIAPSPGEEYINLSPAVQRQVEDGRLRPGDPVFPHRFNADNVAEKRAEGARDFALEHQLRINVGDSLRFPLQLRDLIVVDGVDRDVAPIFLGWGLRDHNGSTALEIDSLGHGDDRMHRPFSISQEVAPYLGTKVWIDPAGKGEDETGVAAGSSLNGFLWVKGTLSMAGGHTLDDMATMIEFARDHRASEIYIESNADTLGTYMTIFEGVLQQYFLEPGEDPLHPQGWRCSLVNDTKITHSTGQKELRILGALEPLMAAHRLVISADCLRPAPKRPIELELQYQITRLTRDRKSLRQDGVLDAIAGLARAWNYTLRTNPEITQKQREKREVDAANEAFRKFIDRHKPPAPPRRSVKIRR